MYQVDYSEFWFKLKIYLLHFASIHDRQIALGIIMGPNVQH